MVVSSIPGRRTIGRLVYWDVSPTSGGHTTSVCNQPSMPTQPPTSVELEMKKIASDQPKGLMSRAEDKGKGNVMS